MLLWRPVSEIRGRMMIARIWQGITLAIKADEYLEYLNQHVIPAHQGARGNVGCFIMKEPRGDLARFLLLSFWASEDSLADFVGPDLEMVNLPPEEKSLLIAYESTASRYEVFRTPEQAALDGTL